LNNLQSHSFPIVLTIAGFDPTCGAGVGADLKTFSAHNCYGVAAITALTVQSTQAVQAVHATPSPTLRAQLDVLAEDMHIAAIKIGMLGTRANAVAVAEFLDKGQFEHVVLDPIIHASAGGPDLLDAAGLKYLGEELIKRASLITPNVPEAALLTGMEISDPAGMETAARKLAERGARAVVITGGHLEKPVDVLFDGTEMQVLAADRVKTENTHGSGCTFASAIAAQLASGRALPEAVMLAKAYVTKAIERAFVIGKGPGPLDHFYRAHQEPATRGVHEVPQHGLHPAAEPAAR
jgi:hydroxymethylpyrimidine kinase/phosphomethylpyrimidine kinase